MTSQLWFQILTVYTKLRYEEKQKQVLELMFQRRVLEQTRTVRLYKYIYCFFFRCCFLYFYFYFVIGLQKALRNNIICGL